MNDVFMGTTLAVHHVCLQIMMMRTKAHGIFALGRRARVAFSTGPGCSKRFQDVTAIEEFLATASWSAKSLLPDDTQVANATEVKGPELRHLLRLSALPEPASAAEETKMLRHLHSQLYFVRQLQSVDTRNVRPLQSLRDESPMAKKENELGLEAMKTALGAEEAVGKYHRRIRRKNLDDPQAKQAEEWDVLGQAKTKAGRFFVVESANLARMVEGPALNKSREQISVTSVGKRHTCMG